jgi:nitronate monooxygenase
MDFRDRLCLEHPLMQAALGGGLATAALAAAVSRAGDLGMVGMLSPNGLAREIGRAKAVAPRRCVGAGLLVPFLQRAHVQACIAAKADAVVLFYGFAPRAVRELRDTGTFVLHQVGTAEQARRAIAEVVLNIRPRFRRSPAPPSRNRPGRPWPGRRAARARLSSPAWS